MENVSLCVQSAGLRTTNLYAEHGQGGPGGRVFVVDFLALVSALD